MPLSLVQTMLGLGSGSLIGFSLALVGGGGSILAVPLMVYVVGVSDPHVAVGTSAAVVGASAAMNLFHHAATRTIEWQSAGCFATSGVGGAYIGSRLGMAFDGQMLLGLFGLLMLAVGAMMVVPRDRPDGEATERVSRRRTILAVGGLAGLCSGFFGIGGGFLVVPGLMASTGMPILNAVGSSLVVVAAFGMTTAVNYAVSGLIDWPLATLFLIGSLAGGGAGAAAARRLARRRGELNRLLASVILLVGIYMIIRSAALLS